MKLGTKHKGFSLAEIIIAITLVTIVATISYFGYTEFNKNGKDSIRIADMDNFKMDFKTYKLRKQIYPSPQDYFSITNSGEVQVIQGKITDDLSIGHSSKDPDNFLYVLSVTKNKQFYQIGMTLENGGNPLAYVDGDYKILTPNLFPSLLLALSSTGNVEINSGVTNGNTNRKKFILNGSVLNLPYDLVTGNPVSKTTNFSDITLTGSLGSRYGSCYEIYTADRYLGTGDYLAFNRSLETIHCDCTTSTCSQSTVSQDGSCNNSVSLGCYIGTAINDNLETTVGLTRKWKCSGVNGGNSSMQCSKVNTVAQNGVCGTLSSGQCLQGTLSWVSNTSACGTTATWNCLGISGGTNSPLCTYANSSCANFCVLDSLASPMDCILN